MANFSRTKSLEDFVAKKVAAGDYNYAGVDNGTPHCMSEAMRKMAMLFPTSN
jgi:hypothetical protein